MIFWPLRVSVMIANSLPVIWCVSPRKDGHGQKVIMNNRNQSTDFLTFLYANLVLHGNETTLFSFSSRRIASGSLRYVARIAYHISVSLSASISRVISEKGVLSGLWSSCIHLNFNHLRTLYVRYGKYCVLLAYWFFVAVHYLDYIAGKKL